MARTPQAQDDAADDPLYGTSYDIALDDTPIDPPTDARADKSRAASAPPREPPGPLVPVAPRHDGWTPQRQRDFIEALADGGSVMAAAKAVGMSVNSAYRLRRRADARAFDAAWEAALERAMARLMPAAIDRALNGTVRQRFYRGELVAEERVHHDRLLVHLLQHGAGALGHHRARGAIREDWEGAMAALADGAREPPMPMPDFKVVPNSTGGYATNAPPPPGFRGAAGGAVGAHDYLRMMTAEEVAAWRRRRVPVSPAQEAERRRFLGLDPAPK